MSPKMTVRMIVGLIANLILVASVVEVRIALARDANQVIARASSADAQPSQGPGGVKDQPDEIYEHGAASLRFEPLLLLLLGATLFSVGTALKVILARQFHGKSMRPAPGDK